MPSAQSATDDDLFVDLEKAAFQGFLRIPGMRSDEKLGKLYWRGDEPTGGGRLIRAMRQDAANKIINDQN
jgi:hypothetical protein